jgi:hypothetical protein
MAPKIEILSETIEAPDKPSDCALVVALPLEQHRFLRQLEEGPDENFARSFRGSEQSKLTDQAVYRVYEKFAILAIDVIQNAEKMGVTVVRNGSLGDFASMLRTHRVTTIVAHSRDAHFCESDIVDPELVLDELFRSDSAINRMIQQLGGSTSVEPKLRRISNKGEIVTYLNKIVDDVRETKEENRVGETTRRQCIWSRRRLALHGSLPKGFRGGNAIEFSDGFVSLHRILETIPATFAGKLDLTSCNSTVFAEDVRRKCKSVLVMANEESTSLDLRLAIYRQVIRRLSQRSEPYEDALHRVRKELL